MRSHRNAKLSHRLARRRSVRPLAKREEPKVDSETVLEPENGNDLLDGIAIDTASVGVDKELTWASGQPMKADMMSDGSI